MPVHIVRQGECLTSIAHEYGFRSFQDIYQHPQNAELRRGRPNPHVLFPGDEIHIPDPTPRHAACATGQSHRFVVKRPRRFVRLQLKKPDGKALASVEYELEGGGLRKKGRTNAEGTLEEWVPAGAGSCTITFLPARQVVHLRLGYLDPMPAAGQKTGSTNRDGIVSRLRNLGYRCGSPAQEVSDDEMRAALIRFQERALGRSEADGRLDAETLAALHDQHGC